MRRNENENIRDLLAKQMRMGREGKEKRTVAVMVEQVHGLHRSRRSAGQSSPFLANSEILSRLGPYGNKTKNVRDLLLNIRGLLLPYAKQMLKI